MARPKKEQNEAAAVEATEAEQVQEAPVTKPANADKSSRYKLYDKWLVSVDRVLGDDEAPIAQYKGIYVKILRGKRPIEPRNAELMNAQTQNNSIRYAETGTVSNGDDFSFEVSRGKKR
jgi:hypothetical protein